MRCFIDHLGIRRADVRPLPTTVGAFLENDIQSSTQWAEELIVLIDQVASGALQGWEGSGNAFLLTLSPTSASIECLWDTYDTCELSLPDLRKALAEWRNFLGPPDPPQSL